MSFVVLGIFNVYTVYAVFAIEVIIVLRFLYKFFNVKVDSLINMDDSDNKYCLALIVGLLYYCAVLAGNQLITTPVFSIWDAIVSWNRWAVSLYSGKIAPSTYGYPQLLPLNWSITYHFMNSTDVQFFAKSIMPLFTLHMLFLCVDIFRYSKRFGYLLAALFIVFMIVEFLEPLIFSGYSDLAFAYFAFNAVCCLLYAQYLDGKQMIYKFVALGGVFAIGSAMVRLNGLYLIGAYPVLAYILVLRKGFSLREIAVLVVQYAAAILVTVFPWYIYAMIKISSGQEVNISKQLALDMAKGPGRLSIALHILRHKFIFVLVAFALLFNRTQRWLVLLVGVPFTVLYIYIGVSSPRYLSIVYPIYGLAAGVGLEELSNFIKTRVLGRKTSTPLYNMINFQRFLPGFSGIKVHHVLIVFVLAISGLAFANPKTKIIEKQIYYKKQISNKELNAMLYDYFRDREIKGKILTSYQPLNYLPGFEGKLFLQHFENKPEKDEYSIYLDNIKRPEIKYLLLPRWKIEKLPSIYWDLAYRERAGSFLTVMKGNGYILIEILDRR